MDPSDNMIEEIGNKKCKRYGTWIIKPEGTDEQMMGRKWQKEGTGSGKGGPLKTYSPVWWGFQG